MNLFSYICPKMEFVRSISGYNHLWSVKYPGKAADELTLLFRRWSSFSYLLDFFSANLQDLRNSFHIDSISEAIRDSLSDAGELERMILGFPRTEHLDGLFQPLGLSDNRAFELTREKARNWERQGHASWMRVYALRLEKDVFVVTGGAIKLTRRMQDRPHTNEELDKMNRCRSFLKENGVFDGESLMDYVKED